MATTCKRGGTQEIGNGPLNITILGIKFPTQKPWGWGAHHSRKDKEVQKGEGRSSGPQACKSQCLAAGLTVSLGCLNADQTNCLVIFVVGICH